MAHETTKRTAESPKISVIVAVFNGAATLQCCIDSVARQSYPNKELIVIDGGSTDGTVDMLRANDERIDCWISEPDKGIYNAWNKGVAKATGDWVCFLGADDWFCDDMVLEKAGESLAQYGADFELIYGRVRMLNVTGGEVGLLGEPWEAARRRFMNGTYCLPTPAMFHRRSIFAKYGDFDESYRIAGDFELQLRALKSSPPLFLEQLVVTNMQQGGISSRPESALIALREMARARAKNKLLSFNLGLLLGFLRVYMRSIAWRLLGERRTRQMLDMVRRLAGKPPYWTKI